jgi:hypothetical protein
VLAKRDGISRRYIRRLVGLAFLSPQLVEAILQGRQIRQAYRHAADRTRSAAGLDGAAQTARKVNRNSGRCASGRPPHRGRASLPNGQSFPEVGLHQCPSERKVDGLLVRSLHLPSHVPSDPQTAAKVRGLSPTASGFTAETDWPLEGAGFELVWGFSCQVVIFGL